jgi:hypothetical protein
VLWDAGEDINYWQEVYMMAEKPKRRFKRAMSSFKGGKEGAKAGSPTKPAFFYPGTSRDPSPVC